MTHKEFTVLAALFIGLAWYFLLRRRNRPAPLTLQHIQDLRRKGAVILDVRTPGEFSRGHARGARNIPLNELPERLDELDKALPVLACCASGSRSAKARSILLGAGFAEVHDAGPWTVLRP